MSNSPSGLSVPRLCNLCLISFFQYRYWCYAQFMFFPQPFVLRQRRLPSFLSRSEVIVNLLQSQARSLWDQPDYEGEECEIDACGAMC